MSRKNFDTDAQHRAQLVKELIEIVGELGWNVGIPEGGDDNEEVPGLIVGTPEYVDGVTEALEKAGYGRSS